MNPARGSDMHLFVKMGEGGYTKLAGLRTKTVSLNATAVEITQADSPEGWQECAPRAGVKSARISGHGVLHNGASIGFVRAAFFEQSIHDYRIELPNFGTLAGAFLLSGLTYLGSFDGEANFELSLTSAGAMSFAPLS